jgi:hypothetical protein
MQQRRRNRHLACKALNLWHVEAHHARAACAVMLRAVQRMSRSGSRLAFDWFAERVQRQQRVRALALRMLSLMQQRLLVPPPPSPPRTKWTRRVPHPVLIGHAASLSQVRAMNTWAAEHARLRHVRMHVARALMGRTLLFVRSIWDAYSEAVTRRRAGRRLVARARAGGRAAGAGRAFHAWAVRLAAAQAEPPPPPLPVLTGHVSSFSPY